jgi:fibronectin-binding autotransporter adhesin
MIGGSNRRAGRGRFIVMATIAALASPRIAAAAADFSPVWNGGTGNWNDAAQWTPAFVPNNGAQTFDATVSAGTATLAGNVTIQKLTLNGSGRISSTTTPFQITANETFTWNTAGRLFNGAVVANGGVTITGTPASPTLFSDQATLTIPAGQTLTSGGGNLGISRSTIHNNGAMQIGVATNVVASGTVDFFRNTLNNAGTLNVTANTSFGNTVINNTGTITTSANVSFNAGGTWTGGSASGSGEITFGASGYTLDAASSIAPETSLRIARGGTTINFAMTRTANTTIGDATSPGLATFNQPVVIAPSGSLNVLAEGSAQFLGGVTINGTLAMSGGALTGATINTPWTVTGDSSVGGTNNSTLTKFASLSFGGTNNGSMTGGGTYGGGGALLNNGSITGPNHTFGPNLTLTNAATGTMNLTGATTFNGVVHNHGPLSVTGAGGAITAPGSIDNHAAIAAAGSMSSTGVFAQYSGASLTLAGGAGTLTSTGGVLRAYAAGAGDADDPGTPGTFTLNGNLVMNAPGANPARLGVEIGGKAQGTQYDLYDINGSAALVAALDIRFLNDFEDVISASDVFTILSADGPLTGSIQNPWVGGPAGRVITADGLGSFLVSFSGNNLVLSDFSTAVPEPAAARAIAALTVAAVARRRRRRVLTA